MTTTADQIARPRTDFPGYRRGDAGYRRITLSLFGAGMATFVAMYAAQAVLPQLSEEFGVGPAASALAVSATTGALAVMIVPASVLSERFGRVRVMAASALLSAVVGLLIPLMHGFGALIALRALQGGLLAGVPATAMAYLAEEVHGEHLAAAMGRYVAGTTIGGLAGRLVASFTLDIASWRWALEVAAAVALAFTVFFLRMAPASLNFEPHPVGLRTTSANIVGHLRNARLVVLFATAFLLMGGFVSVYNILGYRMHAAPFNLPESVVGLLFLMYLAGTVSSAYAGRLAVRFGRQRVLVGSEALALAGLVISLWDSIPAVVLGILVFTAGFFAAHAVASGWVGAIAHHHRAEASSLYMCLYYVGSSVLGALAGIAYAGGWAGEVGYVGGIYAVGLLLAAVVMPWLTRRLP